MGRVAPIPELQVRKSPTKHSSQEGSRIVCFLACCRNWYTKNGPAEQSAVERVLSLEELRNLSGLGSLEVSDVFSVFASGAVDGLIDNRAFSECVAHIVAGRLSPGACDRVSDELFEIFDADGNGFVDFAELASGLSVLCGGSREDKVAAAFSLFDTNGDGFITREEMATYLTSVFKLIYATKPELNSTIGVGPEELGAVTADQAFADADIDQDERISFAEFQRYCGVDKQTQMREMFHPLIHCTAGTPKEAVMLFLRFRAPSIQILLSNLCVRPPASTTATWMMWCVACARAWCVCVWGG